MLQLILTFRDTKQVNLFSSELPAVGQIIIEMIKVPPDFEDVLVDVELSTGEINISPTNPLRFSISKTMIGKTIRWAYVRLSSGPSCANYTRSFHLGPCLAYVAPRISNFTAF